ncbi:beta-galactosidase [Simiduia litorea]|uniref:agarase n=1 Tax=Simiduia litorea TaxID=1435348 RepID=UPI0036F22F68
MFVSKINSVVRVVAFTALGAVFLSACGGSKAPAVKDMAGNNASTPAAVLFNFDAGEFTNISGQGVALSAEQGALVAHYQASTYQPTVTLKPEQPFDWSQAGSSVGLVVDVANKGDHSAQLFVYIYDADGGYGARSFNVAEGSNESFSFDLNGPALALDTGMRSDPHLYDSSFTPMTWMWGNKQLNLAKITKIDFLMKSIVSDRKVVFDNIRIASNGAFIPTNLVNIFDQFGQYTGKDYPGKVHSVAELQAFNAAEAKEIAAAPKFKDRSTFGGWVNGPKLEATGYFRTEKYQGKWALVDPEGYLFWATGVDNMRMANTATMTGMDYKNANESEAVDANLPAHSIGASSKSTQREGRFVASDLRRNMFSWLPDMNDPLAKHYGYRPEAHTGPLKQGESYSFYQANLERKYGSDFIAVWRQRTLDRQLAWGFTTLGNWADPSLYQNQKIAYVANGWILGDHKRISSGDDFWAPMHDPYDPAFALSVRKTVSQVAKEVNGDPWCMGVFIENELSWGRMGTERGHYGLAIYTLARDAADSPAKAAFVALLKAKYPNVADLAKAWNKPVQSWASFAKSFTYEGSFEGSMQQDLGDLLEALSSQFFAVVNTELKAQMPNHLYLGARFADWGMTPEVVRGAAKHVDVMSYNFYTEGLAAGFWDFLPEIDMPSIIGEFHFGALDTGVFHPGLVSAQDQTERGRMFKDYMRTMIDNPWFVGAHWFQYIDSPAAGRAWDGENYNVGFVSLVDQPYAELVEASRQLNAELYGRRFGNAAAPAQD